MMELNNLNLNEEQIMMLTKLLAQNATSEINSKNWKDNLIKSDKGKIENNIDNYILFLNECSKYKGQLKYNEFLQQKEIFQREFTDFDLNNIYNDCERETSLSTHSKIDSAISEVFDNNRYNPIINYLNSLTWDGTERIANLFINLLDADDSLLNKEMTKKWFIAAVKRVYEPGCKFDNMIVLQGEQGIGKSSICELISKSFFNTISLDEIGNKDLVDKLNKTWIAIIDEMDTFNRKEMSTIKTFLSVSQDSVRLAYGRNTNIFKRHCVFIGSTNDETFLRDSTSSVERRFWVIKCNKQEMDSKIRETLTEDYISQLWAEAVYHYKQDKNQYLDIDSNLREDFANTMRNFKTYTDDSVIDYVNDILNKNYYLNKSGEFDSTMNFLEQYQDSKIYAENANQKINKIPMSDLSHILRTVYKTERPSKYIALALSQEWEYKTIFYRGKSSKGLYRKNQIKNNIENDVVCGLPF